MLHDQQQTISYLLEECDAKENKLDHSNKEQWVQKIIQSAQQIRQSEKIAKAEEENGNSENKIQTLKQQLEELEKDNRSLKKEVESFKAANKFQVAGYEVVNDGYVDDLYMDIGAAILCMDTPTYSITELTPEMTDYKTIATYITNSSYATDKNCRYDVDILKIFVMQYKRDGEVHIADIKAKDPNRRLLFHGTSVQSAKAIIENMWKTHSGFEIKESKAGKFGKGIYFTDRMCLAAAYAYSLSNPNSVAKGVLLLNEVALGKQFTHTAKMNYDATTFSSLPENADSVFAQGTKIPEPGVEGVLNDGTVVPLGMTKVIDYDASKGMLRSYNEYIVYRESQTKVRYFIYARIKPVYA